MDSSSSSPFSGSKFINLCLANWSLHLYVYSMIPLLSVLLTESGYLSSTIALAVGAFALGMILPGPFGAYLMERRKRKEVYLKALLLASLPSTAGFLLFRDATTVILLHGLQGVAFGIAQTALGTTLVNDLLLSKYRNRGDLTYAWAGRIGVPLGLLLGSLLVRYLPLPRAIGWSLVPCLLSFLLVAQTFVPIKAPVHVPVVSFDRFFLPSTLPLSLTMFGGPFALGMVVQGADFPVSFAVMTLGAFLAGAVHYYVFRHKKGRVANFFGYLLIACGLFVFGTNIPEASYRSLTGFLLIGTGTGIVSARHLFDWICGAAHCQRGTAQSTYMLSWRIAFAAGFIYSSLFPEASPLPAVLLCLLTALFYRLSVEKKFGALEK